MTLVILAAGMGSRYGGLKQLDPMTKHGEFIIDFSVFDAKNSGVDKVVFIIKKEHEELFKETIGDRIGNYVNVAYAYQELSALPEGFSVPEGRVKPWGTVHALLCAKEAVGNDNMIVINADDFYGKEAYEIIADYLGRTDKNKAEFCLAGYPLKNTLTDNGSVSRGVCKVDESNVLTGMDERKKIYREPSGRVVYELDNTAYEIDENAYASMNFWGFTPKVFPLMEKEFVEFLKSDDEDILKKELCLSTCIDSALKEGKCSVKVIPTDANWFGVTYHEDKEYVAASIKAMVDNGIYPDGLFE